MIEDPVALQELRDAKRLLESPSLAAKLSNVVGSPIEGVLARLPTSWHTLIEDTVHRALQRAMEAVLKSLRRTDSPSNPRPAANRLHKLAAGTAGAMGGAFGLPALAVELPVSTMIILRSIADIARAEGEAVDDPALRLECLRVLTFGGNTTSDDATETGYFVARAALSKAISDAAAHIGRHGLAQGASPAIVRFINQVAARYSIMLTEKMAAQAVPVIGAAGGAMINTLFIDHFQDMAKGHFTVRRLERRFGSDTVRQAYAEV